MSGTCQFCGETLVAPLEPCENAAQARFCLYGPRPGKAALAQRYSHEQWAELLSRTIATIQSLASTKGAEYAHGDDRLDNFRRNGADCGVSMEVCWRIYAGKHWDAITTYVRDLAEGKERVRSESISGRADDLIVYLLLFKAMVEEREGAKPDAT